MTKLSETELQGILKANKADALSADESSKLSEERTRALDMYLGDMDKIMPAPADRSRAISTDVADTVEGLMPSLMEIFASGDEVVRFEPVGPEDEEAAEQETDYVNHVFMQRNPGFLILYSFIKDALLSKNGIVKVWWEEKEEEERETLFDLSDDAYIMLRAEIELEGDDKREIVEHSEHDPEEPVIDPLTNQPVPVKLHDVTILTKRVYGCAKAEPVPPENFGISRRARSVHVQETDYGFHEEPRTERDLISAGYDEKQVKGLPTSGTDDTDESMARDTVEDSDATRGADPSDKGSREIDVTEHYVRVDMEQDGKPRLYKITTAGPGETILLRDGKPDIEIIDMIPFAAMTPVIMTHRFFGRSVADLVMDIQKIKTALLRQLLDNAYLANNQRIEIAEENAGEKTLDDLLSNRPGGIVRTKRAGGLVPIPNQEIGSFAYPLLEYTDTTREWRTGVTRQGQGIDADALQNQSATAVAQTFSAAQAKMKLIARIFAETGIRDLFSLLHATIRRNDKQENTVRLRNKWVNIDPRQWKSRSDMTISVGLGNGGKEQQAMFLMQILGLQEKALASGTNLTEPSKIYNALQKLTQLAGFKNADLFWSDPDDPQNPPKEPPPDPKMIEVQQKGEIEREKMQMDAQLKREQMQMEFQLKQQQLAAELELKRQGMMVNAQVKAATAPVRMGGDVG